MKQPHRSTAWLTWEFHKSLRLVRTLSKLHLCILYEHGFFVLSHDIFHVTDDVWQEFGEDGMNSLYHCSVYSDDTSECPSDEGLNKSLMLGLMHQHTAPPSDSSLQIITSPVKGLIESTVSAFHNATITDDGRFQSFEFKNCADSRSELAFNSTQFRFVPWYLCCGQWSTSQMDICQWFHLCSQTMGCHPT